jgi:ABC-type transport system involved in cytochrome bd biosynthesis fused ATPase/permease subunit
MNCLNELITLLVVIVIFIVMIGLTLAARNQRKRVVKILKDIEEKLKKA